MVKKEKTHLFSIHLLHINLTSLTLICLFVQLCANKYMFRVELTLSLSLLYLDNSFVYI